MKIAIIGGGLAGIAAAHTLLEDKKATEVYLLEASGSYGGRARTDSTSIPGFAFDKGAQYIQDPSTNPLTQIAKDLGFETVEEDARYELRMDTAGGWKNLPTTTPDVAAVYDKIQASFDAAETKPNVIVAPKPRLDTLVEMFGQAVSPYGPFTESAETWQYIAADRAREEPGDGRNNLFVKRGVGTLVAAYGAQLVGRHAGRYFEHFGASVTHVTRAGGQVKLDFNQRSLAVDACILTVPVSVLANGSIRFEPALPQPYKEALRVLRLGSYKKLALRLRTPPAGIVPGTNYYLAEIEPEGVWQYYRLPHSPDVLVAHAAGDFAATLDRMADKDVYELFKASMRAAYPDVFFAAGKAITNWSDNPNALGAYSYTAFAGGGPEDRTALAARVTLGVPLENLHFAGEATNVGCYGTLQAAYFEGVRAARAVLQ